MLVSACMLVLGGVEAIVGAALSTTEKGKECNDISIKIYVQKSLKSSELMNWDN